MSREEKVLLAIILVFPVVFMLMWVLIALVNLLTIP